MSGLVLHPLKLIAFLCRNIDWNGVFSSTVNPVSVLDISLGLGCKRLDFPNSLLVRSDRETWMMRLASWLSNDQLTDSRIDFLPRWITTSPTTSPTTCLCSFLPAIFMTIRTTQSTWQPDEAGCYLHRKEQIKRTVCRRLTAPSVAPRSSPPQRNQYPTMIKLDMLYWLKGLSKFRDNRWLSPSVSSWVLWARGRWRMRGSWEERIDQTHAEPQ